MPDFIRASVTLIDLDAGQGTILAIEGPQPTIISDDKIKIGNQAAIVEKLQQGELFTLEETSVSIQSSEVVRHFHQLGVRSFVNAPLIYQDELIGSLSLGRGKPGKFEPEILEMLRQVADQLAIAIRQGTRQMNSLINDMLTYSRLQRRSLYKEKLHLPPIVQSAVSELIGEIETRVIDLVIDVPCEYVTAEVEGLSQALRNLISNATKFTLNANNPRIEIGSSESATHCLLWIKDNGIGFDMKYHDHIFEIFQRLHDTDEYPGTGVGPALVRKAMERMGGRVWAESEPGAGSTFFLEILR